MCRTQVELNCIYSSTLLYCLGHEKSANGEKGMREKGGGKSSSKEKVPMCPSEPNQKKKQILGGKEKKSPGLGADFYSLSRTLQ